ncbi:type IV toxin-antitoxin system AbiEi family antitoxin [Flavihumibacter profundi]|uniref:type IV toxin-antitoxin system AbiEi family antitoxin n=1 Tax=Flavihumibacter profundi TaxID=2716883 RepID=UPI001CC35A45|nr:type IV toxin-antitoxin system AbiEi family antitoxin [Flavihumibacter profundi]MBZ5857535.1 type IV toxin-antitoxin system AbiEi family antitoxin [Flavihumibacter profundi]
MVEEEIIQEALIALHKQTGITVKEIPWASLTKREKIGMDHRIRMKTGKEVIEFAVQVKNEIRKMHLPGLLERMETRKEVNWLIISQYIPRPLKDELKGLGVNYIEASGNCFVRHGGLYLYINDQQVTEVRIPEQGKLWKAAGLKFLFVVLQNTEMINATYRSLAKTSGIALGNIGPLIEELKNGGYVKTDKNGNLFLENTSQLQKKWVEMFASVLRPKLKLGTFRFLGAEGVKTDWKNDPALHFLWGGEAAGALLTNNLRPEKFAIYSSYPKIQLMKELKLIPDEHGSLELMEMFWDEEELKHAGKDLNTVPPLLAYAELATSLDSRNRETAEKIKVRYLENDR